MAILTSQWPDVYGNLKVEWGDEYDTLERVADKFLNLKGQNDKRKTGKSSSASFYDMARDKDESRPFHEQDPQQGYAITWEQAGVGTGITLSHENFLFEETLDMAEKVRGLGLSVALREEHDAAMRLRYAFTTQFTNVSAKVVSVATADTLALISDSHPIPINSALVDDNDMDTVPFNKANLKTALGKPKKFRNEKGLKLTGMQYKAIITSDSEDMAFAVDEVIHSKLDPDTGTNRKNSLSDRGFTHVQVPGLLQDGTGALDTTGEFYWFVADLTKSEIFRKMAEKVAPVFPKFPMEDPNLPITGDHKVTNRGTWAIFTRRYHFIVGSAAASVG